MATFLWGLYNKQQGGLVGVLNKQPSVIMLNFTVGPGPLADN